MNIQAIFNEFKSQVAFTLALVWMLAVWHFRSINTFIYPLFAVGLLTVLDVLYTKIRFKKWYWPSASFVTGFLIGLIIAPTEPIWIIFAAVFLAFASKQFVKVGLRQHIFNPAALGIMATSLIFGVPVAWWGVAWGKLPLIILIPLMVRILWRMRRIWLPLAFLAVYYIYLLTIMSPFAAFNTLAGGTVLLFALVMLPEPITSPATGLSKYGFGPLVAILAIVLSYTKILGEVFLPALLLANFVAFMVKKLSNGGSKIVVVGQN